MFFSSNPKKNTKIKYLVQVQKERWPLLVRQREYFVPTFAIATNVVSSTFTSSLSFMLTISFWILIIGSVFTFFGFSFFFLTLYN